MSAAVSAGRGEMVDATAAAIMLGLSLTWGLNQVAIKFAGLGFSPMFMMLARSGIGPLAILL